MTNHQLWESTQETTQSSTWMSNWIGLCSKKLPNRSGSPFGSSLGVFFSSPSVVHHSGWEDFKQNHTCTCKKKTGENTPCHAKLLTIIAYLLFNLQNQIISAERTNWANCTPSISLMLKPRGSERVFSTSFDSGEHKGRCVGNTCTKEIVISLRQRA